MEIKISENHLYHRSIKKNAVKANIPMPVNDTFEKQNNTKEVSFGGIAKFLYDLFHPEPPIVYTEADRNASDFSKSLSMGLKEVMGYYIPPANFSSVMSSEEFKKILPQFTEENFKGTDDNIDKGIYCADLDYQSTYTMGREETLFDMLLRAKNYADIYYKKTGKDFIFALTDHDTLEGVQHVIKLVSENPEEYKHLKIVPGLKMSFTHNANNSTNGFEDSYMLIYGVNPFSKNLNDFVQNTLNARKNMVVNFITNVKNLYPEFIYRILEFATQNDMLFNKSYNISNLYWRIREYTQTKGDLAMQSKNLSQEELYNECFKIMTGLDEVITGSNQDYHSGKGSNIINDKEILNKKISEVFSFYSTHYDEEKEKVVSYGDNVYEDMIEVLSKEKEKPVLALAEPYDYAQQFEPQINIWEEDTRTEFPNVAAFFNELQEKSNGMLAAIETVAPKYDKDKFLTQKSVDNFNSYILKNTNLKQVGGSFLKIKLPNFF